MKDMSDNFFKLKALKLKGFLSRKGLAQFIKFNIVGLMNTIIDFIVFSLLLLLGIGSVGAQIISYIAGSINSYVMNRNITFASILHKKETKKIEWRQFIRFGVLNLTVLAISLLCLYLLITKLGLHPIIAKIIVTGMTVTIGFYVSRKWVFRENDHLREM
ncbi:Putative flippase GtrA (transmembrane translocase of bactoprenol-linked glucose) [Fontibacillus panacisegetis]|uniref:Putative flippase GtrA (Transmembrane translocase of bactoprenol-linked glucose) n=2 Tax=Fontibacillus panacisegetis TaxID=670482 RepID=A0A1G7QFK7_9BACL|nr:Putative flippase GtrA (transmembrane translocase of bactoprenol-linked glucose) [Fontibacillus panacisegetis]